MSETAVAISPGWSFGFALVGSISGVGSILAFVWLIAKMKVRLDLMWKLLIEDGIMAQMARGEIATGSGYRQTSHRIDLKSVEALNRVVLRAQKEPPGARWKLGRFREKEGLPDDSRLAEMIIQEFGGIEELTRRSREAKMSPKDYIAQAIAAVHEALAS